MIVLLTGFFILLIAMAIMATVQAPAWCLTVALMLYIAFIFLFFMWDYVKQKREEEGAGYGFGKTSKIFKH